MKFLHTSDWHLGKTLYGFKRYSEFQRFLDWLLKILDKEEIDVLLVAGDIFDTTNPSHQAQGLYYQFLSQISQTCCQHVIIIAGNHDSPSLLNAPKELLKFLSIHVVSYSELDRRQHLIPIVDQRTKETKAIVCAVPYLRDQEIRVGELGESLSDKEINRVKAITQYYQDLADLAKEEASKIGHVPIIAMGHLFTVGGKVAEGDGVRELYVGSMGAIKSHVFSENFDYVALGHLHVPQKVDKKDHVRYSGSPLPIGFHEACQPKQALCIEFFPQDSENSFHVKVDEIFIPCFQILKKISGNESELLDEIDLLKKLDQSVWLEIEYTGKQEIKNLRQNLAAAVNESKLQICCIKNSFFKTALIEDSCSSHLLENLDSEEIFLKCLDVNKVQSEEDRVGLLQSYQEIIFELEQEDH